MDDWYSVCVVLSNGIWLTEHSTFFLPGKKRVGCLLWNVVERKMTNRKNAALEMPVVDLSDLLYILTCEVWEEKCIRKTRKTASFSPTSGQGLYSLVQWNWFSHVTGCTWISYIQWRQIANFTAPGCINHQTLPAMQWHACRRFLAFLSGNLALLFLRLPYILNEFKFRSFVKSLSMWIESSLTTIFFLETKSLPSIPTKRYESEPNLPKPKLLLPNAGRSNRHCLSIEKTPNRQRSGKLTMSSRLAGWSPRLC